ncbi:MAG: histone deacetylase family protein, partial [Methylomonas sp.]
MKTLYYSHPDFLNHDTGHGHPESASRLQAINQALSAPKFACLRRLEPEIRADIKELLGLIHTPRLINKVLTGIPQQGYAYLDSDTVVSPGSASAALLAVSAVCDAVDKIMLGEAGRAFCAVRPPGHHAEPDKSMGFCLFNNIAIAAAYALSR